MKKILLAVLTGCLLTGVVYADDNNNAPPKDQFVTNPAFKENGTPAVGPKLNFAASKKQVEKVFAQSGDDIQKMCSDGMQVYRVTDASSVKVTTFKNFSAPVPGKFTHMTGYVAWTKDKPEPEAELVIDTTSWDSGVPDRDARVMHHLLQADQKANAIARVKMSYKGQNALQPGVRETKGQLEFRGKKYDLTASNKTTKDGAKWTVKSVAPARFESKLPKKDLQAIMKYCNHKSLSSTVDLEWNLVLESACK